MFVEYPMHHLSKCWLIFNLKIKKTQVICDVVWLQQMYYTTNREKDELNIQDVQQFACLSLLLAACLILDGE